MLITNVDFRHKRIFFLKKKILSQKFQKKKKKKVKNFKISQKIFWAKKNFQKKNFAKKILQKKNFAEFWKKKFLRILARFFFENSFEQRLFCSVQISNQIGKRATPIIRYPLGNKVLPRGVTNSKWSTFTCTDP